MLRCAVFAALACAAAAATFNVTVGPDNTLTYDPANLTVQAGDTVRFNFATGVHNAVLADSPTSCTPADFPLFPPIQAASGETREQVMAAPGVFPIICTISNHCEQGMRMLVTVEGERVRDPQNGADGEDGQDAGASGQTVQSSAVAAVALAAAVLLA